MAMARLESLVGVGALIGGIGHRGELVDVDVGGEEVVLGGHLIEAGGRGVEGIGGGELDVIGEAESELGMSTAVVRGPEGGGRIGKNGGGGWIFGSSVGGGGWILHFHGRWLPPCVFLTVSPSPVRSEGEG